MNSKAITLVATSRIPDLVSHKVIRNLLLKVHDTAEREGVNVRLAHKAKSNDDAVPQIVLAQDHAAAASALDQGAVVGATAWHWANDKSEEALDYLFVDEAGQMSLAVVLAASRSTQNIILLGDPQQLEQPQQGTHPEGSGVSALDHVLGQHETMPDAMGLFLDRTWRLHPGICQFTSEVYYEDRLQPRPGLENQTITGDTPFVGSGLRYVPVPHEGNQNCSAEEVETVARIVRHLLSDGVCWTDANGDSRRLNQEDVLIVAPYNAQVAAILTELPGHRVGTVDRFQGQEAPIVIYSATSSSMRDAPRGMGFLYNPNRLNVATSRARCLCILVASPQLLEPECRTPQQIRWANVLCRFKELAIELRFRT